jgi:hypothetical protein
MTVKVRPATVMVPVRVDVLGFGATVKVTVPLPLPVPADVRLIQVTLLVATQLQPAAVVTLMLPLVPFLDAFSSAVGLIENVHGTPA